LSPPWEIEKSIAALFQRSSGVTGVDVENGSGDAE
jgi:hypothetical protein